MCDLTLSCSPSFYRKVLQKPQIAQPRYGKYKNYKLNIYLFKYLSLVIASISFVLRYLSLSSRVVNIVLTLSYWVFILSTLSVSLSFVNFLSIWFSLLFSILLIISKFSFVDLLSVLSLTSFVVNLLSVLLTSFVVNSLYISTHNIIVLYNPCICILIFLFHVYKETAYKLSENLVSDWLKIT